MTRHIPTVARALLGLLFLVFGLNGFLHFMPNPPVPARAGEFLGALGATGYMFPLIKGTEVVGGALLLGGRFVPLALVLLAPVIVNIALFHLILAPGAFGLVALIVGLELFLAWSYRDSFARVLRADARPLEGREAAPRRAAAAAL